MDGSLERVRYVLVASVPREVEVLIEDAYLHLAGSTRPLMGYHVTLLGPFYLLGDSPLDALPGLAEVCGATRPFDLVATGMGAFHAGDTHTVYLSAGEGPQPDALHWALVEALHDDVEMCNEHVRVWNLEGYKPHITLGMNLTDQELDAFMTLGLVREPEIRFTVNQISLVQEALNGLWQHVACYPLGATADDLCDEDDAG